MKENNIAIITAEELSFVEDNILNEKQLKVLMSKTPKRFIKERPAKGGGSWKFVSGSYIKKALNLIFGWDWDFEIQDTHLLIEQSQVIIQGKLTVRSAGKAIVKTQFGRADIKFRTETRKGQDGKEILAPNGYPKRYKTSETLDLGNDMKAAATDALKKCASELGIAQDIYSDDFVELKVVKNINLQDLKELFELKGQALNDDDYLAAKRIIDENDRVSFEKLENLLKQA